MIRNPTEFCQQHVLYKMSLELCSHKWNSSVLFFCRIRYKSSSQLLTPIQTVGNTADAPDMYAKYVCIQIEGAAGVAGSGCSTYEDNRFSITACGRGGGREGRLQLNVEQVSVPPLTTTPRQNGQTRATILYPLLGCNVEIKVTRHLQQ